MLNPNQAIQMYTDEPELPNDTALSFSEDRPINILKASYSVYPLKTKSRNEGLPEDNMSTHEQSFQQRQQRLN